MATETDKFRQYEDDLKRQIDEWNRMIADLRNRVEQSTDDAAQELRRKLDEVDDLKRKFEVRLEELQSYMSKQWENKKLGVERARSEVNLALDQLRNRSGKKNAR